jgi:hypothetical protein
VGGFVKAISEIAQDFHRNIEVEDAIFAVGVNVQVAPAHGDTDMVRGGLDVDELGVGIFAKLAGDDVDEWQEGLSSESGFVDVAPGSKAQASGDSGSGHPEMDMRTAEAVFIDVHADDTFMECVSTGDGESGASKESRFCDEEHGRAPRREN